MPLGSLDYDVPELCLEHIRAILKAIKRKNDDLRFHFISHQTTSNLGWLVLDRDGRLQRMATKAIVGARKAGTYAVAKQSAGKVQIHDKRLHFLPDEVDKIPKLDKALRIDWPKALKQTEDKDLVKLAGILRRSVVHLDEASLHRALLHDSEVDDVQDYTDEQTGLVLVTAEELRAAFEEDADEAQWASEELIEALASLRERPPKGVDTERAERRAADLLEKIARDWREEELEDLTTKLVRLLTASTVDARPVEEGEAIRHADQVKCIVLNLNKLLLAMEVSDGLLDQTEVLNQDVTRVDQELSSIAGSWGTDVSERRRLDKAAEEVHASGKAVEDLRDNTLLRARRKLEQARSIHQQLAKLRSISNS